MNNPTPPRHFTRKKQILDFMLVDGPASRLEFVDTSPKGAWRVTNGKETATATRTAASHALHSLRRVDPEKEGQRWYYTAS